MDIELLERLDSVEWRGEVADLGCGTGRTGAWLAGQARDRGDRRRGPDARDARPRARAGRLPRATRGRRLRYGTASGWLRAGGLTSLVDEHLADLAGRFTPRPRGLRSRRELRPGRLPPILHHGVGHAHALRQRVGRTGRDRDLPSPAQRPQRSTGSAYCFATVAHALAFCKAVSGSPGRSSGARTALARHPRGARAHRPSPPRRRRAGRDDGALRRAGAVPHPAGGRPPVARPTVRQPVSGAAWSCPAACGGEARVQRPARSRRPRSAGARAAA